jgi:hypothetical protein
LSEPTSGRQDGIAEPVNEARAKLYERLMEAQERIANACYRRGMSHQSVLQALDAVDERLTDDERREDLYLAALTRYVQALGGRVELRAVFGDDIVVVHRDPAN